jgi:hypothetical protein
LTVIVVSYNTTFLTADAFIARYGHAAPGATFSYAKGDLAVACQHERDAVKLRDLVREFAESKKVALTQRPIADTTMRGGGRAFEYLATKRSESKKGSTT